MGQLKMTLGVQSEYEWKLPKTAAEVIELSRKFSEFEAGRLPGSRLLAPSLAQIRDAQVRAEAGQTAAQEGEVARSRSSVIFHNTMTEATPLLKTAIDELLWKYRADLGALEDWGLPVRQGARGKFLVTKPKNISQYTAFLSRYVAKEASLPEADRLTNPPLATLQALAATAQQHDAGRTAGQTTRIQGTAIREAGAGPLLDLLQLACGLLVVTLYDGQITPALMDWGYNIIATPGKTPEPPAPLAPTA